MINRRNMILRSAALGSVLLPRPTIGSVCDPLIYRGIGDKYFLENAEADIRSGKVFIGRAPLRVGSAHQPYSISKVRGDLRHLRFEVRTGDRASWDWIAGSHVDRSEVIATGNAARFRYGTSFWWAFSMLIEEGPEITGDWCVIGQLHQSGVHPNRGGANPPFSFGWHTEGGKGLSILTRASSTSSASKPYIKPTIVYMDDAYPRGQWVRWLLQFRFSWEGDAVFKAWRDGLLVVDLSGPHFKLGYQWDSAAEFGTYCQFGIYRASAMSGNIWRSPDRNPMVVHYSDFDVSVDEPICVP